MAFWGGDIDSIADGDPVRLYAGPNTDADERDPHGAAHALSRTQPQPNARTILRSTGAFADPAPHPDTVYAYSGRGGHAVGDRLPIFRNTG